MDLKLKMDLKTLQNRLAGLQLKDANQRKIIANHVREAKESVYAPLQEELLKLSAVEWAAPREVVDEVESEVCSTEHIKIFISENRRCVRIEYPQFIGDIVALKTSAEYELVMRSIATRIEGVMKGLTAYVNRMEKEVNETEKELKSRGWM